MHPMQNRPISGEQTSNRTVESGEIVRTWVAVLTIQARYGEIAGWEPFRGPGV